MKKQLTGVLSGGLLLLWLFSTANAALVLRLGGQPEHKWSYWLALANHRAVKRHRLQ